MTRTTATIPLLALVVLALAACAPAPPPGDTPADPRPTPTGSSTPLPAPTETLPPEVLDPLDTVTRILLQTENVYFCDATACAVDGFRYDGSPDAAIAKLTAVFGEAPTGESFDEPDGRVSAYYAWDQFMLYFTTRDGVLERTMGVSMNATSVGDVVVETEHGVRVGTPWADVVAVADSVASFAAEMDEVWEARFDSIPTGTPGEFDAIVAFGNTGGTGGPVTSLTGPITTGEYPG